jgi:ribosomal-protein-serine acetyltransferase
VTPLPHSLSGGVMVRPLEPADTARLLSLIVANRAHLDRWLRWSAAIRTADDAAALIDTFATKRTGGDGFHCGIWCDDELAGGVVCWYIHRQNRNAEVGYWLGERFVGRGLAVQAAAWAVDHLFTVEALHRVEMQCGVANGPSRAVAERLGFTQEGIRRESHWITDRFVDHVVYGMLDREWAARGHPGTR